MKFRHWRLLAGLLLGGALMAVIACGGDEEEAATQAPAATAKPAATAAPAATAKPAATAAPAATADPAKPAKPAATAKPAPTAPATAPAPAGSVTIAIPELAPLIQYPRRDISALGGVGKDFSVYETLVRAPHVAPPAAPPMQGYDPDDNGIAKSWEVSSDLTSITFEIRENIPWHTLYGDWGTVDAEDVAFTYNAAFATDSVNNGAEEIGPEMKLGFDVLGPMTVKQNIEEGGFDPTWAWLQGNAGFNGIVIVNKDAYDELGDEEFAKTPIGTGKYTCTSWKGEEEVRLEAVTEHWTGIVPHVKYVNIVNMPEEATRDAALRAGEIDIGQLTPQTVMATVAAIGGRYQEIGVARPQGFQLAGNYWGTTCPGCEGGVMPRPGYDEALAKGYPWVGELGNAESMENARLVRWAMAMTVDQESIVKYVLNGLGRPIYAWQNVLPDDPAHKDEWVIPYDVAKAKEFMTQAGYPNGFDYEMWVPANFAPGTVAAAEATAEMWRQNLGMNVTIDKTEYATRRPQTVDKTINVPFTHGINWIPGATSARYICPHAGHIVGFTLEDELCEIGLRNATEPDVNKRIANNFEVQDYLSHWMLFIPMYQTPALLFAVGPRIDQWDPYNTVDVLPNRPESMTLK